MEQKQEILHRIALSLHLPGLIKVIHLCRFASINDNQLHTSFRVPSGQRATCKQMMIIRKAIRLWQITDATQFSAALFLAQSRWLEATKHVLL